MRPENFLGAIGIDFRDLDDEERAMKGLLIEQYTKEARSLVREIKEWREKNPKATLGEAIRALFEQGK